MKSSAWFIDMNPCNKGRAEECIRMKKKRKRKVGKEKM
jgi:hypothetical protein